MNKQNKPSPTSDVKELAEKILGKMCFQRVGKAVNLLLQLNNDLSARIYDDDLNYNKKAVDNITALISEYVSAKDAEIERLENDIKISDKKTQILYDTKDKCIVELEKRIEQIIHDHQTENMG